MKIRVEHRPGGENEVVLRCESLDEEMLSVLALLMEASSRLPASKDGETHMLEPGDVYYADAVDNKTFLYTKDAVYETASSLAQLESRWAGLGYVRIGKSQVVNLRHIDSLKSYPDRRIALTLTGGERLIVSRHYRRSFEHKLGMDN